MSTRANVKIKDSSGEEVLFYRHSDGYPSVTGKSLEKFLEWVKEGKIRKNVSQASGWLVMLGAKEYDKGLEPKEEIKGWKVGAYEPTTRIHSDIDYLYTIDLEKETIKVEKK